MEGRSGSGGGYLVVGQILYIKLPSLVSIVVKYGFCDEEQSPISEFGLCLCVAVYLSKKRISKGLKIYIPTKPFNFNRVAIK